MISSLTDLTASQKEQLVASLATLLVGDNELSADKLGQVATASGNTLSPSLATLFSSVAGCAPGGVHAAYVMAPGGGGGGSGGGAAAATSRDAPAAAAEEKEEEEEVDMGGGMDMFGGGEEEGGGGGGDY
jgi:large subunit ribosomal protein LP1